MSAPSPRYWIDLTTAELGRLDRARMIALLPVGATEQHGPHLPLSVDSRIAAALIKRLADGLPADFPLSILPMIHFGVSPEHADFPGTISVSAETMLALLMDVGRSAAAAGIRKLAILNSHGGQPQLLDLAAQKLRRDHGMLVFPLNGYRYWNVARHFGAEEAAYGIHGGAAETSIMLAVAAEAVRRHALADFPSLAADMAKRFKHLRPYGRIASFGWQAQDLNPAGAVGNAAAADAAKGEALLAEAAATLAEILIEIDALSPDVLKPGPAAAS
ncbi:MAG: creatininase family protein [Rhodospirillaceae bacterium]|nr:creatininase family protein [Rhodospirillaceae bacterium]